MSQSGRVNLATIGTDGIIGGAAEQAVFVSLGNVTGTATLDFAAATAWSCTLTGNTTIKPIKLPTFREKGLLRVTQDATGGRAWTIEGVEWAGGTPPIPLTANSHVDVALYVIEGKLCAALVGATV